MKQDERSPDWQIHSVIRMFLILVPLLATLFSSFKPTKDVNVIC